jgi:ketosteroid isomerase-like protein
VPRADENGVARVRESYEAWNDGGLDAVARDHWHPDIELQVPPGWEVILGTPHASGREQVVEVYRNATAAIQDSRAELIDVEQVGDEFVCTMRFRGRGEPSGVDVESLQMFQVLRLEDGLVRRIRFFGDVESARSAAADDG